MRARAVVVFSFAAVALSCACTSSELDAEWASVSRDDLVVGVEVSGTLESIDSDIIKPPNVPRVWRFKIVFMAPEGEDVARGAPVIGFDANDLKRTLQSKENEYESAVKQLEQHRAVIQMQEAARRLELAEARGELRKARLKADTPADLAKAVELKKARLDLQLAEDRVKHLEAKAVDAERKEKAELSVLRDTRNRAQARIAELKANIARMMVKAGRDGAVIYRSNWKGEKAKVGDDTWRGRELIEVAGAGGLKAVGSVDEVDVAKIAEGQVVRLRLDAQPDVEHLGAVDSIADSIGRKSAESPVKVAKVEVVLDDQKDEVFRPGMRYRGEIEVERLEGVLVVPADAVFVTEAGPVAYVRHGDGAERVALELGARSKTHIEVLSGLAEGDEVSLSNLENGVR